jgi:hypothetical protein
MFNQRGQAAIFVALMFNVLFVFFAMAINIALVVHDKINLQNSADLAAYYAASKQAEILNVIAHENYMIRQSYKLLAWRYRVLGTLGYENGPAIHPARRGDVAESVYPQAERPSLCVSYFPNWVEIPKETNPCNRPDLRIPPLPEVKIIAGFLGVNAGIAALSRQLRLQFDGECDKLGAMNWWFGMSIMHAFRMDQYNRKQIIYALARNLSRQDGDFVDLDGNSVLQGARTTFLKNLTFANKASFEAGGGDFQLRNSLAALRPEDWLVEIKVIPTLVYTDLEDGSGCNADPRPIQELPQRPNARTMLTLPFPQGLQAQELIAWKDESFLRDSAYQFALGVEKNPWYMPYVGLKVKTRPRQIFFPLGSGVDMVARAFAKPFGGRIGPWYKAKWDRGAQNSSGDLTDTLVAPRVENGGLAQSPRDPRRLPNYARFPGDTMGLSSRLALNSIPGIANLRMSYEFYKNIKEAMTSSSPNDILAWNPQENNAPIIREMEIAAIAPDLFDITYYSIEPNFTANYLGRLRNARNALQIPSDAVIRSDLGNNGTNIENFSVQDQMKLARDKSYHRQEAFYFVRDKAHLLTSWLPGQGAFSYDVSNALQNFGKCAVPDDGMKFTNPGSCIAGGGRTGYSVKIIGRDALLASEHQIGGPEAGAGEILNPPTKFGEGW